MQEHRDVIEQYRAAVKKRFKDQVQVLTKSEAYLSMKGLGVGFILAPDYINIGSGAFGDVLAGAWKRYPGRRTPLPVAIKRLTERALSKMGAVELTLRELVLTRNLSHVNLMQGFMWFGPVINEDQAPNYSDRQLKRGSGTEGIFIVTEMLQGGTLWTYQYDRYRPKKISLPFAFSKVIIQQVLYALKYLQSHRIVHGDLHSGNVMFSKDGTIKLIDLGRARVRGGVMPSDEYQPPPDDVKRGSDEDSDDDDRKYHLPTEFQGERVHIPTSPTPPPASIPKDVTDEPTATESTTLKRPLSPENAPEKRIKESDARLEPEEDVKLQVIQPQGGPQEEEMLSQAEIDQLASNTAQQLVKSDELIKQIALRDTQQATDPQNEPVPDWLPSETQADLCGLKSSAQHSSRGDPDMSQSSQTSEGVEQGGPQVVAEVKLNLREARNKLTEMGFSSQSKYRSSDVVTPPGHDPDGTPPELDINRHDLECLYDIVMSVTGEQDFVTLQRTIGVTPLLGRFCNALLDENCPLDSLTEHPWLMRDPLERCFTKKMCNE